MSLPMASVVSRMILTIICATALSVFSAAATQDAPPELVNSASEDRSSPFPLEGTVLSGDAFIFASSTPEISDVFFFLDVPVESGLIFQHEGHAPYDFAGTASGGVCREFDTTTLADGPHTIRAVVVFGDGTREILESSFLVQNTGVGLLFFAPSDIDLSLGMDEGATASVTLATSNGDAAGFSLSESAPWLSLGATSGSTPATFELAMSSVGLADGTYHATVIASAPDRPSAELDVTLTVETAVVDLAFTPSAVAQLLETDQNATVTVDLGAAGDVAAFTLNENVAWLSLGTSSGTTPASIDLLLDSTGLADGTYQAAVTASTPDGPNVSLPVTLTVDTEILELVFTPGNVALALAPDESGSAAVVLSTTTGSAVDFTASESAPWLSLTASSGTTPMPLELIFDSTGLSEGVYQSSVEAVSPGLNPMFLSVELIVGNPTTCFPLPCDEIIVSLPFSAEFRTDESGILDANLLGTGFTAIEAPDGAASYRQDLLAVNTADGVLELTTTRGIHHRDANSQINTLGVGLDLSSDRVIVRTKLLEPNSGTGRFEQAGLWFGIDNDNFIKFAVVSTSGGNVLQGLVEMDGVPIQQTTSLSLNLTGVDVGLELEIDPVEETVTGYAMLDETSRVRIFGFMPPSSFFGGVGASIDPEIGTNSFAGIFGTHRFGPAPVLFRFEGFEVDLDGAAGSPSLAFSESKLSFALGSNQQSSADVELSVSSGQVAAYTLDEFEPWLSLSATSGMTPETVNVLVDTTGLTDGIYTTAVTATSPGLPTLDLPITVTVQSPVGELVISPSSMSFDLAPDELSSQTAFLMTSGGGTTTFTAASDADWLTLSAPSGTASGAATGPGPAPIEVMIDTTGVADGSYTASVTVSSPDALDVVLPVALTVVTPPAAFRFDPPSAEFLLSFDSTDSVAVTLSTSTDAATLFTLTENETWLELSELSGTTPSTLEVTVNSTGLPNGVYLTQVRASGTDIDEQFLTVQMTVDGPVAELNFTPGSIEFQMDFPSSESATATLNTTSGVMVDYALIEEASWLEVSAPMGTTPQDIEIYVDATGLEVGVYQAVVAATAEGFAQVNLAVQLTVGNPNACSPLPCEQILVDLPFALTFTEDHGGLMDSGLIGTGFTTIDAPDGADHYRPDLLVVDAANGVLEITTTRGLHFRTSNDQVNTLGVGLDAPNQVAIAKTTLIEPTGGAGNFEQGGLWFGIDDDNFMKFVVASTPTGTILHALLEVDGIPVAQTSDVPRDFTGLAVDLEMVIDPENERVTAFGTVGGQNRREIARFSPPAAFFSFDAAGINPAIGTRSFVGIFGSHRFGPAPLTYRFKGFSIGVGETADSGGGLDFLRTEIPAEDPTNLVWGPDDRLYVTSLLGRITANTLDPLNQVIAAQTINSLTDAWGNRLTLGIAIGPESTSSDVVLYVAHSNASLNNGQLDSAVVTRLAGPNFETVTNVITGLPRAPANHSINSIHFGPAGRLFIAVGSNTGSGAPNTAMTEFGDRAEQPLSAAILVADIFAPSFDGTCQNVSDPQGAPPCDVTTWATGVRNMYDFVFHSNGNVYGPDNGLGAVGTFPPSAIAPCFGYGDVRPVGDGGQNPGSQSDPLHLLVEGGFYGHPNPSRGECIFGDGSLQGVSALPNYRQPLFNLGDHRSANGITEYPFDVGCVPLGGDLLIANYSVGDNITRIVLSDDGQTVIADEVLVGGFVNPIALTVNPAGTIFVAELGSDQIAALIPRSLGCWVPLTAPPEAAAFAGSAMLAGRLFTVGGRSAAGRVSATSSYQPLTDTWTAHADLPGAAREGIAAAALNGALYAFGGTTSGDGSGATDAAFTYDSVADSWSALPPMGTARTRATAVSVDSKLYVIGGVGTAGIPLASGEVFDPATGTWAALAPMSEGRDAASAFAVGSELFVVGGQSQAGALASMESYDPGTGLWSGRAAMPTARHSAAVGNLEGRFQIAGGEGAAPDRAALVLCEEYDPATDSWRSIASLPEPRVGSGSATIHPRVYLSGGTSGGAKSQVADALLSFEF